MFCVEEHKWDYSTRIYIGELGTHPHLGATRPRVGICLSRLDALTSKYNTFYCQVGASTPNLAMPTRGGVPPGEDALPAGEGALPAGEDAFLTRAYVRVHNIYLETFFVPCFIFIIQCIDNQYFQEMKHWHSMFHF